MLLLELLIRLIINYWLTLLCRFLFFAVTAQQKTKYICIHKLNMYIIDVHNLIYKKKSVSHYWSIYYRTTYIHNYTSHLRENLFLSYF